MAIPGHELVRAHFSNNERTIVEAFWTDGEVERVEYIEAKGGDPNWENLLTHIDIDDLHEATYKHIKQQNEAFEASVVKIAKERGLLYDIDELSTNTYKVLSHTLFKEFDEEQDKEKLFLYKLSLFEIPAIKQSKSSAKKKKLRQAKNMLEATTIAISIVE
tara:strand:- start:1998 stop:2480 length:483 start_codon:yes stop_codon:yes gene_type:complete